MKHLSKKKFSIMTLALIVTLFFCNLSVYAAEEDEIDDGERVEFVEGGTIDQMDQYVDGIYNSSENARATLTGFVRLAQSGTKLHGSYASSYSYTVDRIGVKNVKLQYKGSLGLWHTIITIDDRYFTNQSTYAGSFDTTGTMGRTYRLKCTHYVTDNGTTETRNNVTGNLTFE